MRKNRKTADTYRFNGHPSFHGGSILSVTIVDLESRIRDLEAKWAAFYDPDDKKWTAIWLSRYRQELAKKRKGLALKQQEKIKRNRTKRCIKPRRHLAFSCPPLLPAGALQSPLAMDGED